MAELDSPAGELPYIPDNLTLAQFILDSQHPSRPVRKHGIPWLIDDHTGRTLGYEEVRPQLPFTIKTSIQRYTATPHSLRYVHEFSA